MGKPELAFDRLFLSVVDAICIAMQAAASSAIAPGSGGTSSGSVAFFEPAQEFEGARPGTVFKLGHLGLGYYLDVVQTLLPEVRPKLPEKWRDVNLREERLRVDPEAGA